MSYRKLVADGVIVVAFQDRRVCDISEDPDYIKRYLGLAGIKVEPATGKEYLKYKRTRKKKRPEPTEQKLF